MGGALADLPKIRGGEKPAGNVPVAALKQRHQERQVGVGLHITGEVRYLPVPEELGGCKARMPSQHA